MKTILAHSRHDEKRWLDPVVVCAIGDGEAGTGPLVAARHSKRLLDPEV